MPRSVSHLDAKLDWDLVGPPSEHCGLWNNANGNLNYVATHSGNAVWPTSNSAWGPDGLMLTLDKRFKASANIDQRNDLDTVGGLQASLNVSLFYENEGKQNPGAGDPPNWFFYWAHTTATEGIMVWNPNIATARCLWDHPTYTCELGTSVNGPYTTPQLGANANTSLNGIDSYAWTCRHEWQHHNQMTTWWGAGGWVHGQDNKDKKADGSPMPDGVPDALEAGFDAAAGGPYDNTKYDTYPNDGNLINDMERHCVHTQSVWSVGSANASDWSHPGKQWP